MHRLCREVRFSINPFLSEAGEGFNSYASKPCGEGLSLYFNLCVEVEGEVDGQTGFVINVGEIDRIVRKFGVPVFGEHIKRRYGQGQSVGLGELCEVLTQVWGVLSNKFGAIVLRRLVLALNPFRKMAIESEDSEVIYFSEKFEFSAMHTLWNDDFSRERNFEVFGKCANPAGHGHNYIVEVTVTRPIEAEEAGWTGDFERIVDDEFISIMDHKNLNTDVSEFKDKNPTVENIAAFAWERLFGKFVGAELSKITVWENDRTYCVYKE